MKAVLLLSFGSPRSIEDVPSYYTHIRGGRTPSEGEIEILRERYRRIGGRSPLIDITESQKRKLQEAITREGSDTRVYFAMLHSAPLVTDVVKEMSEAGVTMILGIPLAPHYSEVNTATYTLSVDSAIDGLPREKRMNVDFIRSWHTRPDFIEAWARRVKERAGELPRDYSLVFSAHSLPESILARGDTYPARLLETCELVASALDGKEWSFAFQSASHTREPWLGPDLLKHLETLRQVGSSSFLIAPIGFVSDNLEILFDLDVECKEWAGERGVTLKRARMLNDEPDFISCLFELVSEYGYL